ncbi:MAG: XRE family transcriptional regulator [Chitinophagaceae bacterium]|jgi:DNA-directed RNA polymerase specialized sigma subunit|nr:MAG: XRE family transcriptional regulator [Chitinophagaceae bacterium]
MMKNNQELAQKHAVKRHHFALAPHKAKKQYLIPLEVVNAVFDEKSSSIRAWRKYLGLCKKHLAQQLRISRAQYSRLEDKKKLSKALLRQVATAMGIHVKQLEI